MDTRDHQLSAIHALASDLKSQKVVPLRRLLCLRQLDASLCSEDPVQQFLASLETELLGYTRFLESLLLDRVEKPCLEANGDSVEDQARQVGADYEFRRLNRSLRLARLVNRHESIPQVYVRAHIRRGGRVRETWRLVGFEHLAELNLAGRSKAAVEVIRWLFAHR
jgi:hypothetical protein